MHENKILQPPKLPGIGYGDSPSRRQPTQPGFTRYMGASCCSSFAVGNHCGSGCRGYGRGSLPCKTSDDQAPSDPRSSGPAPQG